MKKWMFVVWGLLFSMFLGMTAMAAPQCVSVEEDVKLLGATYFRGIGSSEDDIGERDFSEECAELLEPWDQSIPLPTLEKIECEGETTITGDYQIHVMGMKFRSLGGGHNSIRMDLEVPGVTENSQVRAFCWDTESADYGYTDNWEGEYSNRIRAKVVEDNHVYMETYYYAGPTAIVVYDKEPEMSEVPEKPSDSTPDSGASVGLTTQDAVVRDGEGTESAVTVTMGSTEETLSAEAIKSITGSERNYTVHTMDLRLMNGEDVFSLIGGQFVELEFKVSDVHPESDVRVLHYTDGAWEGDSATVVSKGEGIVKVRFTALSPVAILVYNESSSGSGSGSGSHRSHSQEEEEVFWTTPLSSGAAVMVNGAPADLQIGPATRFCSEEEARILLGTTGPCKVYMADLWLLDQVTKDMVLPGEGGALITLNVPGVIKGSNVKVRHWPNGSTEPVDLIPEEVGDGYIKVRFTTLGQVAVCVADTGAAAPADTAVAATGEANVRKSPKTSDHAPVGAAGSVALLSALGLLYFRKRNI